MRVAIGAMACLMAACGATGLLLTMTDFEEEIFHLQNQACLDILGERCTVVFEEPDDPSWRAWATCSLGHEMDEVVIHWNKNATNLSGIRQVAYHEACHVYFFRFCGCFYTATTGAGLPNPPKGTREGDANHCRDRFLEEGLKPNWGCNGEDIY